MRKFAFLAVAVIALAPSFTFADIIPEDGMPTLVSEFEIGTPVTKETRTVTAGAIYSNVTNFSGSGALVGGATGTTGTRVTKMLADDISLAPSTTPGSLMTQLTFCVGNFNASATAANTMVRIYADSGANAPGSFLLGLNFNPITFNAGSIGCFFFNLTGANQFAVPASLKIWAGLAFYSSTTTTAALNNLGTAIFNPVDVGSSADQDFYTTANGGSSTSAFVVNGPTGAVRTAPYVGLVANHGWEFVPEPTSLSLLGLGALMLIRRKR